MSANSDLNQDAIAVSVIVPVYNAAQHLPLSLKPLLGSTFQNAEVLVVDDHSTDNSAEIAEGLGAKVIHNPGGRGPAAARNFGSNFARGDVLFFVDSDVVAQPESIAKVYETFQQNPNVAAVFGSYDQDPACRNFLSQYKNLFHHYIHQMSSEESHSFWAGCGAIRKNVFQAVGGFKEDEYRRPSIEDIELGNRLSQQKYLIRLDKNLQAKHLKRWTWLSVLKSDIFDRAFPWSKLILQSGAIPVELNLKTAHRLSAILVAGLFASLLILLLSFLKIFSTLPLWLSAVVTVSLLIILLALNRALYIFFLKQRGFLFTLKAIFWHLFYYFYSGAVFGLSWVYYRLFKRRHSLGPYANATVGNEACRK